MANAGTQGKSEPMNRPGVDASSRTDVRPGMNLGVLLRAGWCPVICPVEPVSAPTYNDSFLISLTTSVAVLKVPR